MRHSPFTAVYDACVLYPAPLRDFLMWLGLSGRFRARWSQAIHEWKRNLLINRPDLTRVQVDRTSDLMDRAIPDGLVEGYEALVAGLTLPDPDDRHVLAAAIRCGASVIVTFNERDFPNDLLAPYGIESQHPDEFVDNLLDLDAAAVVSAAQRQRAQLKHPPIEVDRYLEILLRQGLVQTTRCWRPIAPFSDPPRATDDQESFIRRHFAEGIHRSWKLPDTSLGALWDSIVMDEALKKQLLSQAIVNFTVRPKVERTVLPCTA